MGEGVACTPTASKQYQAEGKMPPLLTFTFYYFKDDPSLIPSNLSPKPWVRRTPLESLFFLPQGTYSHETRLAPTRGKLITQPTPFTHPPTHAVSDPPTRAKVSTTKPVSTRGVDASSRTPTRQATPPDHLPKLSIKPARYQVSASPFGSHPSSRTTLPPPDAAAATATARAVRFPHSMTSFFASLGECTAYPRFSYSVTAATFRA